MKKGDWEEISEDALSSLIMDKLQEESERFTNKVKKKDMRKRDKLDPRNLIGKKAVEKVYNKFDPEVMESQIVARGRKKIMDHLEKGDVVEMGNCDLKKKDNKFYVRYEL